MSDGPIDPKRFPVEHPGDYAAEGNGRCRTRPIWRKVRLVKLCGWTKSSNL